MQYSDPTNKQGIVEAIRYRTKTNGDTYTIEDITREVNLALNRYFIIASNFLWDIDDTTYSTYEIATTDLVLGQRVYSMPADLVDFVSLQVKDSSGNWTKLTPIDESMYSVPLEELYEQNSQPMFYDKRADGVFLYPASNYNSTGGVKIEYKRKPNYFIITDELREPGIPAIHHEYLILYPTRTMLKTETTSNYRLFDDELVKWENDIKKFWSRKGKDTKIKITPTWCDPT